jgi:hypothetical protein
MLSEIIAGRLRFGSLAHEAITIAVTMIANDFKLLLIIWLILWMFVLTFRIINFQVNLIIITLHV